MSIPVSDLYSGATFFSGPSSFPGPARMTVWAGWLDPPPLVVPQAARIAGSEVNAAPVTAVRLTNSRRLIRCIPFPPLRFSRPTLVPNLTIVLRSGRHDNCFCGSRPQGDEGDGGPEGTDGRRARPGQPGAALLPTRPEHGNGH